MAEKDFSVAPSAGLLRSLLVAVFDRLRHSGVEFLERLVDGVHDIGVDAAEQLLGELSFGSIVSLAALEVLDTLAELGVGLREGVVDCAEHSAHALLGNFAVDALVAVIVYHDFLCDSCAER